MGEPQSVQVLKRQGFLKPDFLLLSARKGKDPLFFCPSPFTFTKEIHKHKREKVGVVLIRLFKICKKKDEEEAEEEEGSQGLAETGWWSTWG